MELFIGFSILVNKYILVLLGRFYLCEIITSFFFPFSSNIVLAKVYALVGLAMLCLTLLRLLQMVIFIFFNVMGDIHKHGLVIVASN